MRILPLDRERTEFSISVNLAEIIADDDFQRFKLY